MGNGNLESGRIRIAEIVENKIGKITTYEVTSDQLKTLEKGNDVNMHTTISTTLLGAGISFIIAYFTCSFEGKEFTEGVFLSIGCLSLLFSIIMHLLGRRNKSEISMLCSEIRNRK